MEKAEYLNNAFILSYGTGQELIPVGYFYSHEIPYSVGNGEVKQNPSTKMEKFYFAYSNNDILFFNIFNEDQIIALPTDSCAEIFSNCTNFKELGFLKFVTSEDAFKILLDEYSFDPENMPHITGIPMNEVNAKWCTDEDLGYNYSIIPVKVKK